MGKTSEIVPCDSLWRLLRKETQETSRPNRARKAGQADIESRDAAAGCVDPEAGRALLDYSLDLLSPGGELDFEAHMLACDHCFDALRGLDQVDSILRLFVNLEAEPDPTPARSPPWQAPGKTP